MRYLVDRVFLNVVSSCPLIPSLTDATIKLDESRIFENF